MSDVVVVVLTALLALGVLVHTVQSIWCMARRTPMRERALAGLVVSIAGTVLLGVVFPAALKGVIDPWPVWLGYAFLTTSAAVVLGWRWPVLGSGNASHLGLLTTSCVLAAVLAVAGFAVT